MIYLSGGGAFGARVPDFFLKWEIGLMITPWTGVPARLDDLAWWAADTGCFSQGEFFDLDDYLAWLTRLPRTALFATAPDVPYDHEATLARSRPAFPKIRQLGFKPAFVAQNGSTVDNVPWAEFDVLFIGGDTKWKLSRDSKALVDYANRIGLWTHMGRVNSKKRYEKARYFGCRSVDGTFLCFAPEKNLSRIKKWIQQEALFDESRRPLQRRD
jgi:hypothetical protein